ncbi:MAG: hypothetical protein JW719_13050 [Pirellulales bacterium]|nr:hypothetical protein [Pirellulales bacterium]
MVSVLLMAGYLMVAQQQPVLSDGPAAEVRRLVRQLDAPRLEQRNEAEAKLIEMGPAILPALPADEPDASAEVRQRLARVRQALEQKLAAAAVEPSRVTLAKEPRKLSALLGQIERQTGNRIIDTRGEFGQEPSNPELTLLLDKTPFWKALQQTLQPAGLNVYPFGPEQAVYVVDRRPGSIDLAGADVSGPFLFAPLELIGRRKVDDPEEGSLQLALVVAWEPRLSPIGLTQKLAEIQAVDEKGNSLEVDVRLGRLDVPVGPKATSVRLAIPFVLPPRDVQKIGRLSGTLDALVPGPVETFRFTGLPNAKEVRRRVASATVTLVSVRKNNDTWEVEVRVRFDEAGDALASHRGWIFENEAYLEGPDGKRLDHEGFETRMQTENEVGLAYFFYLEDSLEKYTFVYKTPAKIFTSRFKYELRDLELP